MKKVLLFSLLIFAISCKVEADKSDDGLDLDDMYIQEIGKLYYPEEINVRPEKVGPRNEEKDYIIEIINSDSLKENSINLRLNSKNIAYLYKKHLIKNKRIPKNIIVNIKRRNGNNESFEFEDNQLIKFETVNEKTN
jgi:hypothetical protein